MNNDEYFEINRTLWNRRTALHLASDWYKHDEFRAGATSLKAIELDLLGAVAGQSILHLQCHFGQDTLSLARMGADVVGVDISDSSIEAANALSSEIGVAARFVLSNVYDLPSVLSDAPADRFDRVFVTYGAIGWLPDIPAWAAIVRRYLKPGGKLVLVEFHPFVWTFDDAFLSLTYDYDDGPPIVEEFEGTYGAPGSTEQMKSVGWNHGLGTVIGSLLAEGMRIDSLREYDWSPYDCFENSVEFEPGRFRVSHVQARIPMVYSVVATAE